MKKHKRKKKKTPGRWQAGARYWEQYHIYLESPEWRIKRGRVLARANYICERCKQREAVEVHHLSYAHVFDEPLCELQAVCYRCHEKRHKRR